MALIGSLTSGVAALKSFSKGIEVIGNNISNVNTTGYKTVDISYEDSFSNMLSRAASSTTGAASNTTNQIGTGVQVAKISSNFTQGSISSTGVLTDLAINGNGFFKVHDNISGKDYATRAGSFRVNDAGQVLTSDGKQLQGLNGGNIAYTVTQVSGALVYTPTTTTPSTVGGLDVNYSMKVGSGLTVDSSVTSFTTAQIEAGAPQLDSYAFDTNGKLTFYLTNGDSYTKGQVLLMNFTDPNALTKEGSNLYSNFDAAGPLGGSNTLSAANNTPGTNGLATFKTQALESSNVDLTQQFADLITTQRSFQAGSRIITVSDDILQEVVNLKR